MYYIKNLQYIFLKFRKKKKKIARIRHSQTYNKRTDILTIISQKKKEIKKGFLAFHPLPQVRKNFIPTYPKQ